MPDAPIYTMPLKDIDYVEKKLLWMEQHRIWPNGLRYLWTDALGLVLYLSLYEESGDKSYLTKAEQLVKDVYHVLGRDKGLRIGEQADRDGQYFHYLAMWVFALGCYGRINPVYREKAIKLAKEIHPYFVIPGQGVIWKMQEDLLAPYPGYGLGAMDAYDGYVVYQLLDEELLATEINDMLDLVKKSYRTLTIDQDLGLGMMLWLCHFFPDENWSRAQKEVCLNQLDKLWVEPPGYFCRQEGWHEMKFAFTNYGLSLGLQAIDQFPERVSDLNAYFDQYQSGDEYDTSAITHVMACTSHFPGLFISPA